MIHPDMATMLAFITTDAKVPAPVLGRVLRGVVDDSFNSITVDGETSTNDMVLCMANGAAAVAVLGGRDLDVFAGMLKDVCRDLAEKIVRDGEGASKFIRVVVTGAAGVSAARRVARAVAVSPWSRRPSMEATPTGAGSPRRPGTPASRSGRRR